MHHLRGHLAITVADWRELCISWYFSLVNALHVRRFSRYMDLIDRWGFLDVYRGFEARVFVHICVVFRNLNRKLFLLKRKGAWPWSLSAFPSLRPRALFTCYGFTPLWPATRCLSHTPCRSSRLQYYLHVWDGHSSLTVRLWVWLSSNLVHSWLPLIFVVLVLDALSTRIALN